MLSRSELEGLVDGGESDRVEFTASLRDMNKIRQAICAFANDLPGHNKPGVVFVGIEDDGGCAGLKIGDELLRTLGGLRSDGQILPFPVMEVGKQAVNGCETAVVQVEPSDNPPLKVDGRCWIRVGPRRAQASAEEERRLTEKRRWGDQPFDMQEVCRTSVADLEIVRFELEYLPKAVSPEALAENRRSREEQLQTLRLLSNRGVPTTAAVLTLGKEPQHWFPGAFIEFGRFNGREVTDGVLSRRGLKGVLQEQLHSLDLLLEANVRAALVITGAQHEELPDYPLAALRELVRNAVIHRTYEGTNAPIHIRWFSDRVQITSPGGLYGKVTPETFGQPNSVDYRNPTIAGMMRDLGFMERFGIGLGIVKKELEKNGNPPPEFEFREESVSVTVTANERRPSSTVARPSGGG